MLDNIKSIIQEIKSSEPVAAYISLKNLFKLIQPVFCKFNLTIGHTIFYRVRSHTEGDGNYFFDDISKLSYRKDNLNIRGFGRCNEPFQSLFYCSNNDKIALFEVSELTRKKVRKEVVYHTVSAWKMNSDLLLTTIFEPDNVPIANKELLEITRTCLGTIDNSNSITQKEELKFYLKIFSEEFAIPFANDDKAYLLSAAFSNYLLETKGLQAEMVDGIVYPSCLGQTSVRNLGLNYVFRPDIIGYGNKIEFFEACRSKLIGKGDEYWEAERIYNVDVDRLTGRLIW